MKKQRVSKTEFLANILAENHDLRLNTSLERARQKISPKKRQPAPSDQAVAREQLRRMVAEYEALKDSSKRTKQRMGDYADRETGEIINECRLSEDQKAALEKVVTVTDICADAIVKEMRSLLKAFPIYNVWLKDVLGIGEVTAAKLLADIDITRATKVSALHKVCGLSVWVDEEGKGHAERCRAGTPVAFHNRLKVGLYQAWTSLQKCSRRHESPYFRRAEEYAHRLMNSPRFQYVGEPKMKTVVRKDPETGEKVTVRELHQESTFDGRKGGKAIIHGSPTGSGMKWRPAMQLFVEHLYIVWRTLEGLDVWPSYEAAKLGYGHGAKVVVNAPVRLTLDQALEAVGALPLAAAAE